jgi:hypothetical protein
MLILGLWSAPALLPAQESSVTNPPDAQLYYRRTHGGAYPPPGVNPSDHSDETNGTAAAAGFSGTAPAAPRPKLANGINPNNLGKGDWIWEMSACERQLHH